MSERERLVLGSEPRYNRHQVAELARVSEEHATRLWRSLGFAVPEEAEIVFTDADVNALRLVTELTDAEVVDPSVQLAVTRALSQAMARLAEWQVDILYNVVTTRLPEDADPEAVQATRLSTAGALVPHMETLLLYVWRRHLLAVSERTFAEGAGAPVSDGAPGEDAARAVGFADVVGFTSLSGGLDQAELARFLDEFEATTSAVVSDHGGRVIKTIGDEIMFSTETASTAADIGLDLADRISTLDGRPDLRIGLAYGPVLRRLGDAYGTVVNLASRLTDLARPGTVLVDGNLGEAISGLPRYRLKKLRRVSVRGFDDLQPWLLRRRDT